MNRLCRVCGIDRPIVQAPTASIAGPDLCAAVSEAGGLGSMGVTWTPEERLIENIRAVKARTDRPFFINYALHFEPATLDAALAEGVPMVSFSWGNPGDLVEKVKAAGAKVAVQAGSVAGAAYFAAIGADLVILQGVEAGGHVQSHTPLEALLAEWANLNLSIPLVAAGGLADAEDVRRVIALGADGAMLGTRFVATQEADAHPDYKRRLLESEGEDTAITNLFGGGWPDSLHRVLRNATFQAWEAAGCPPPGRRMGDGEEIGRTALGEAIFRYEDVAPRGGFSGEIEEMCLYAGTGVGKIDDLPKAGDLVRRLWPDPA